MTINHSDQFTASVRPSTGSGIKSSAPQAVSKPRYVQEPIAVVGMACRLPGHSNNPVALWNFLKRGGVAHNEAPESRFNLSTHHDGSKKPKTMRSPGGMFLEDVDPQDFDAQFFDISRTDAIAMDPQQRQLLEVVYECLENAGLTLEDLDGAPVGCFVGSYAVDYADMQARDPDDRAPTITVGVGRAILSNRISHFLNVKGPSMTIDTACSGSLVGIDLACRYLSTGEVDGAIVAGANLYLSPEHNMDGGAMKGASSLSGKCHTFDVKADGYIKAEAINAVVLKRLDDAVRDGDPIRAVIRGSATNSDGRTPGIASPSSEAQASAIQAAYANAGISDLSSTTYIECHGTGTQAGDPLEVKGISSVFAATRTLDEPLIIGSIKSNIGHSEPAAGISGLLKAILAIENGFIPGNPTFETPNPKIDFQSSKVRASKVGLPWPRNAPRRASVNSFGYGGSNAHVVLEDANTFLGRTVQTHVSSFIADNDDFFADTIATRPFILVLSANDERSLRAYCKAISKHLINPGVSIKMPDLAYTLSDRRSRHFHRAYVIAQSASLDESAFVFGKRNIDCPRLGFVFTGQGAQWSQMGKGLVETFPLAKMTLKHLDDVLKALPSPPPWSLLDELVKPRRPEALRLPKFSQPLVTALQLVLLSVLESWGVQPQAVVGHSSGEIAAAYAAGLITREEAIKIAYFRGQAASECNDESKPAVGMLAVGLGADQVHDYLNDSGSLVQIACYNSPSSVTLSGDLLELEKVKSRLTEGRHFARLLQVDLAYHSSFMGDIGKRYAELLFENCEAPLKGNDTTTMFSSVSGYKQDQECDAQYWVSNAINPVRFEQAISAMVSEPDAPNFLIEVGPSGAFAGPISQIKNAMPSQGTHIQYCAASSRGKDAVKALFDVAGRLFISGGSVDLAKVNKHEPEHEEPNPSVVVDLPNYVWNHSTRYWHESESSKDWRFRQFPHHDLLGSKLLGTPWHAPSWKKTLRVEDLPWLKDHRMGHEIVFPGAGYIAMAMEAIHQTSHAIAMNQESKIMDKSCYRLRDVVFPKALVLEEDGKEYKIMLTLTPRSGIKDSWYEFKVSSLTEGVWSEHSRGLVRLEPIDERDAPEHVMSPLTHTTPGQLWYKAMHDAGYNFGPRFQKQLEVESVSGIRQSRSLVSLIEPDSKYPQSLYPMHPACIDGCMQTSAPSLWKGNRSSVSAVLVPAIIDSLMINFKTTNSEKGISISSSKYVGRGRRDETKNYMSEVTVYDTDTGSLLFQMSGLRYHKLDTRGDVHAAHSYSQVAWKPDITCLTQEKLSDLLSGEPGGRAPHADGQPTGKLKQLIDLIAHKKPNLKVMEVNMVVGDSTSVWLDSLGLAKSSRAAHNQCSFVTNDAAALLEAQEKYEAQSNAEFSLIDFTKSQNDFATPAEMDFDFVILTHNTKHEDVLGNVTRNVRKCLGEGGQILLLEHELQSFSSSTYDPVHTISERCIAYGTLPSCLDAGGTSHILQVPRECLESTYKAACLYSDQPQEDGTAISVRRIDVVSFSKEAKANSNIIQGLVGLNWQVFEHSFPFDTLPRGGIVLVMDELFAPLLKDIQRTQWQFFQTLLSSGNKILWITEGSQFDVTNPDNALIHGLARTVRAEDPSANLTTLDVGSNCKTNTLWAINCILKTLLSPPLRKRIESEYVERDGVIYISRILPDGLINQAEKDDTNGAEPENVSLHEAQGTVRLRCERVGTLESLHWAHVSATDLPLFENCVEVELAAAGVNFKDVAVTMGIVPENQHLLGLEGAGVIRRVGKSVKSLKIRQRVMVFEKGTFANRIIATTERVYPLPDRVSFEDASTMPSVYLTTIYSLFDLAGTHKGHRVLIHSASGGVGIASIQLCQYIGAEIFATVGTDEKREFLTKTFGIRAENIFSSRSTAFATELMSATNGQGVDVIINSLTGDLLDESWRCIADGGTMVEIGKKDILDRNSLAMEPFGRNATYRGFDMSHEHVSDSLISRLLSQMMDLMQNGHIKPIAPIKVFSFEDIVSAFRFMRGGSHVGKIVISNSQQHEIMIQARPAPRTVSFRNDVSYLIVGGLKGLCGSLAIYLARLGAKQLVVLARSGYADERSQAVLKNIRAEGCEVDLIKGDVSVLADVQRTFRSATAPIGGLFQGAMALRDKIFTSMTAEEYHQTTESKVQGTWNLHNVALEQNVPLDFFTMLSSISGVVGQKGQANYAAGNVFLDNFSAYRHRLGLPACSVDLGAIQDVGYVSEHSDLIVALDAAERTPINEGLFHKIVRFSLMQQMDPINKASASQLITGIAIPQKDSSSLLADARFGPLCFTDSADIKGADSNKDGSKDIQAFFVLLRSGQADKAALLALAVDIVNKQFTTSLRLSEPMEPAKPLTSYGMDSLAAVEFRNWVRMELGAELTTLEITNATSLFALCEKIIAKLASSFPV